MSAPANEFVIPAAVCASKTGLCRLGSCADVNTSRSEAKFEIQEIRSTMREIKRTIILLQMLVLSGCATGTHRDKIAILTVTTDRQFGGEARFSGEWRIRNGCLVASAGKRVATPIFDTGVILQPDASAIRHARNGVRISVGQRFHAGTAWIRNNGGGWSVSEIEAFFGIRIPSGCPTADIIRLHDFEPDHHSHP